MAKTIGRTKKTETFTTRLEPKTKYTLELLARLSGRSIAKALEQGIELQAKSTAIEITGRPELNQSLDSMMAVLWSPQEWKRLIALAAISPGLLSHLEECKLSLLFQSRGFCSAPIYGKNGALKRVELIPGVVEIAWPLIEERAEHMAEGKPAPHPLMEEIKAAHGQPFGYTFQEDGMMMDFSTFNED
ncbi:hypothetical protein [Pseudomonas sp. Marseille-QA0892]